MKFILVGHSLGCRVISSCLEELSITNYREVSEIHLLGGAIGNNEDRWNRVKKPVSGNIYNYSCQNDNVLKTLYKVGTFFASKPIGTHPIEIGGVVNIDVTESVSGHMDYKNKAHTIIRGGDFHHI